MNGEVDESIYNACYKAVEDHTQAMAQLLAVIESAIEILESGRTYEAVMFLRSELHDAGID